MHPGHLFCIAALQSCSMVNTIRPFNTVSILMYHNVTDAEAPSYRSIRVKDFHEQMQYLKEHCEVIALSDLINIYSSRQTMEKTRRPRVVITFDDGFRDNYCNAFPILKKFGLPAAISVVTNEIRWNQKPDNDPQRQYLNYAEMKDMRNNGIAFCSHTHTHPDLGKIGYLEQKHEITKGIEELYSRFPDPEVLQAFVYPFGEYNDLTLDILKELNFKVGLTVWHRHNGPVENPLRLKRLTADGRNHILKFAGQLNPYIFKAYYWYLSRTQKRNPPNNGPTPHLNPFAYEI